MFPLKQLWAMIPKLCQMLKTHHGKTSLYQFYFALSSAYKFHPDYVQDVEKANMSIDNELLILETLSERPDDVKVPHFDFLISQLARDLS